MAISPQTKFFPYETIRPQQQEIIEFIEKCLNTKQTAIIEAATGVGKTIAVLSPLIDYLKQYNSSIMKKEDKLKILVLGRTHSQADRVIQEVEQIVNQTGTALASVSKRGKQSLCLHDEVKNQPSSQFQAICTSYKKNKKCQYFLNSMNPNKLDFVSNLIELPLSSSQIIESSSTNECCPAEITNILLKQSDIISCSYHYLFSESIRSMFLNSIEIPLDQLIIVVDECHNLQEATISMNSVQLNTTQINNAIIEVERSSLGTELFRNNKKILLSFLKSFHKFLENVIEENEEIIFKPLNVILEVEKLMKLDSVMSMITPEIISEFRKIATDINELMVTRAFVYIDFVIDAAVFLFELMPRKDALIIVSNKRGKIVIELKKLDPAFDIANIIQGTHNSILMTGTLGHPSVFRAQNGLFKDTSVLQLPSPYKQELGVYQVSGFTSKYSERDEKMYKRYVKFIHQICLNTSVNIGLYVTSYAFLDNLFQFGLDEVSTPIFRSERGMNSKETDEMIDEFRSASKRGGGLLCSVMGGRSSEGTDFPGEEMEVVIIAGLPYPPKTVEQDAKFSYYEKRTKSAWNICYTNPAFTQINQAAGRAIRSLHDKALIFLLDDRIKRNKSRLTGWMKSGFKIIENSDIKYILADYFD